MDDTPSYSEHVGTATNNVAELKAITCTRAIEHITHANMHTGVNVKDGKALCFFLTALKICYVFFPISKNRFRPKNGSTNLRCDIFYIFFIFLLIIKTFISTKNF